MHLFDIKPHVGIGPLRLKMTRTEVREALARLGIGMESTTPSGQADYFCEASIQVEYDKQDETVQFVGVSNSPRFEARYHGVNVFDTPATDVFELFARNDGSGLHEYSRNEYLFVGQILTLWDADEQYDRRCKEEREIWAQIGVGDHRYFGSVLRLRGHA